MNTGDNVLIIPDTHLPFEHRLSLDFLVDTQHKYKCSLIYHMGDLADWHANSFHDHNPDGFSPLTEISITRKKLKDWYKAFPKLSMCVGNHDERLAKVAYKNSLSSQCVRAIPEIFEFPKGWDYRFDHYYKNVRLFHGMGYSGPNAHIQAVKENQCSIIIGHLHSNAGIYWTANEKTICFGMATGCLIDRNSYAFQYERDFRRKPIIGCGVLLDGGKHPIFVPMKID